MSSLPAARESVASSSPRDSTYNNEDEEIVEDAFESAPSQTVTVAPLDAWGNPSADVVNVFADSENVPSYNDGDDLATIPKPCYALYNFQVCLFPRKFLYNYVL